MNLSAARELLARLSAKAPRQAVETLLDFVKQAHAARLAAIFVPEGEDGLTLFASFGLDQAAQDWVFEKWAKRPGLIKQGVHTQENDHALVPILYERAVVGLLYLETPSVNMDTILDISNPLSEAILRSAGTNNNHPVDEYLGSRPSSEIDRRRMMILLERYHWKKSYVAEAMGVSRTTIYRMMERLNIPMSRPVGA